MKRKINVSNRGYLNHFLFRRPEYFEPNFYLRKIGMNCCSEWIKSKCYPELISIVTNIFLNMKWVRVCFFSVNTMNYIVYMSSHLVFPFSSKMASDLSISFSLSSGCACVCIKDQYLIVITCTHIIIFMKNEDTSHTSSSFSHSLHYHMIRFQ